MVLGLAIETSGRLGSVVITDDGRVVAEDFFVHGLKHAAEMVPRIDALLKTAGWKPADIREIYVSVGPGSFTGLRIGITLAKTLAFATGAKIVAVPTVEVLAHNAPAEAREVIIVLDAKRDQIFTARLRRNVRVIAPDSPAPSPGTPGEGWGEGLGLHHPKNADPHPSPLPAYRERGPELPRRATDRPDHDTRLERWSLVEPAHLDSLTDMLARSPRPIYLIGEGIPFHEKFLPPDDAGVIVTNVESWRAQAAVVAEVGHRMAREGNFTDPQALVPLYIRKPEAEEKYEQKQVNAKK